MLGLAGRTAVPTSQLALLDHKMGVALGQKHYLQKQVAVRRVWPMGHALLPLVLRGQTPSGTRTLRKVTALTGSLTGNLGPG